LSCEVIKDPKESSVYYFNINILLLYWKYYIKYFIGAISEGANVLFGGDVLDGAGYFMNPCVMECSDEMTITKEEHFGPVLQLYKFKTEDEAVMRANATELGLAAGVFSNDHYTLQRVGDALEAGTIYHNCYNLGRDLKLVACHR